MVMLRPDDAPVLSRWLRDLAAGGARPYPHTESTVPQSRKILERILDGVPDEERRKIVRDNAARLYGFEIG